MIVSDADLRLLKVFAAVTAHGGFSAAQTELNISQSTISNHISALESRLGFRVCERGRAGFKLTEKGQSLYASIEKLFGALSDFSSETSSLKGDLSGSVRIGLIDSIITDEHCRLSETFREFYRRPNSAKIEVIQGSPKTLQVAVLSGEINFAIGSFPHKVSGVDYEFLYAEDNSVYCSRHHRLFDAVDKDLDLDEVLKERAAGRAYWRSDHRNNRAFASTRAIADGIEHQLILILSGAFIGYVPDHVAAPWVARGELRRLEANGLSYSCDFHLISKSHVEQTKTSKAFLADLRTAIGRQEELTSRITPGSK
jgi:DNA-binding transcriptional LysR family regulator